MSTRIVSVHLHANLKEKAGAGSLELEIPEACKVGEMKTLLRQTYPALAPGLARVVVLLNDSQICLDDQPIPPGAEITLIPPIAGG